MSSINGIRVFRVSLPKTASATSLLLSKVETCNLPAEALYCLRKLHLRRFPPPLSPLNLLENESASSAEKQHRHHRHHLLQLPLPLMMRLKLSNPRNHAIKQVVPLSRHEIRRIPICFARTSHRSRVGLSQAMQLKGMKSWLHGAS